MFNSSCYVSRLMTKPTKWLCICPVWSECLLSARRKLGSLATHWAHSEDSDQTVLRAHVILLVLSWGGSCCYFRVLLFLWYCNHLENSDTWKIYYRKHPKYSDTRKFCCNPPKIWTRWLYHRVMRPKDAAGIANSVDPDQRSSLIWLCTVLPRPICPKT